MAPGYTQVPLVGYSQALGFGWNDLTRLQASDGGGTDPLTRDFHYGLGKTGVDKTFQADVPNGTCDVTVLLGGRSPQDRIDLYAEGQKVASQLSVGFQETLRQTFRVPVTDGQLDLRFVDTGGASRYFAVRGLEIVPVLPPALAISDVSVTEGNDGTTSAFFTVTLSRSSSQTVTVNYATADGSATTADGDCAGLSGTLTFAPGVTSQSITVAVNGDTKFESDEDFFVNLSGAINAGIAAGQGRGLIVNDDLQPTLSISDVSLTEGNDGMAGAVFTVSLSNASCQPITVNYATADGTATTADGDYASLSGMLTFAPGQTSQTISVTVNGDFRDEPDEDFLVNLSGPVNAGIADGQGLGVILDDGDAVYVVLDAAWLAAHGAGPYVLDQAGKTYVLLDDVRTAGTAFVAGAANVTLDLNGHTVTYGDSTPATVLNAGFEMGTSRTAPGWDLGGAPAAALAPNTSLLFGNQLLRLSNFTAAQRIVSDPISIPLAGHTYTASITPANPNSKVVVQISAIDAATGQVLSSGTSDNPARGFSALAHFTPGTTNPVRLQIDITSQYGNTQSVDLDQAALTVSGDYGVLASQAWSGDILGFANLSAEAGSAYKNASNFTVKNGFLIQGRGDGYGSSPLYFRSLPGIVVEGVQTLATGMDTESLNATYATVGVAIRNSTFREDIDNISNRMDNFATLKLNAINGPILIEGNHLLGSPQVGIMLAGNDPQYTVGILNNEIRQNAVVTNGYAITFSTVQNFTIAGNTIIPINGKGINLDGYKPYLMAHGEIYGNCIDVQERDNREYPTGLEAVALRLRNSADSMGPHRDLSIHDNTFIARTGPGLVRDAHAVRISYVNNNGAMNDAGIALENNLIKAIVTTSDTWFRARALMLDRVDAGIGLRIAGNVLESNDVSLALTNDTAGGVTDVDLFSNTLRKSADGAVRAYTGILAGYYNREIHDVRIFDTRLENGATASIVFAGTGLKDLSMGWLLDVKAQDSAGNPLSGAAVSVLDRDGTQVGSDTTGPDGWVRGIPVVTSVYRQTNSDPRQITEDSRGPHRIQASCAGSTVFQDVTLTASLELALTID